MITKKALAIRSARATQPASRKVKSTKGANHQPCQHPDHQIRCISLANGARRCHCGKDFPVLTTCEHPYNRIAVAKRIGAAVCERCGKTLVEGVPADKYGDPLNKNAVVVLPNLNKLGIPLVGEQV